MAISDEELIALYLAGNELSLKELIDRYTPQLYNFVVRFVGATHAPDVVQDTFIKVWKSIKRFDVSKAHFKTWVFTIARNTVTDYLRKKKMPVFSELDEEDDVSFAETVVDADDLPDEALIKLEETRALNALLEKLPSTYKAVLVLYYQQEMTFKQIGESLGKPLNTVKSHHRRAVEQLRKLIS